MHVEACTTASAAWAVRCHLTTVSQKRNRHYGVTVRVQIFLAVKPISSARQTESGSTKWKYTLINQAGITGQRSCLHCNISDQMAMTNDPVHVTNRSDDLVYPNIE